MSTNGSSRIEVMTPYVYFIVLFSTLKTGGFPGGSEGKESAFSNSGDPCLILGSGRSPREENGNPLQYPCLGNPMDRGLWQAVVHGVTKVRHDLATKPPP